MPTSVFNSPPDKRLIDDLLDMFTVFEDGSFGCDRASFKRAMLSGELYPWLASVRHHYHDSTKRYVDNVSDYGSFLTVARQQLAHHGVQYASTVTRVNGSCDKVLLIKCVKKEFTDERVAA